MENLIILLRHSILKLEKLILWGLIMIRLLLILLCIFQVSVNFASFPYPSFTFCCLRPPTRGLVVLVSRFRAFNPFQPLEPPPMSHVIIVSSCQTPNARLGDTFFDWSPLSVLPWPPSYLYPFLTGSYRTRPWNQHKKHFIFFSSSS